MGFKRGKKSGLVYFGYDNLKSWKPCYDPVRHIPADWRGTAIGILKLDKVPAADKIWVVCRTALVSERVMRLFAVWSARQVQDNMADQRSLKALDVAEAFANGLASKDELSAAYAAADAAAAVAGLAAYAAAAAAATYAADDAAYAAADAAADGAATYAARLTARDKQIEKLIEMVIAEGKEHCASKKP